MEVWLKKYKWNLLSFIVGMTLAVSCGACVYHAVFEEVDHMVFDTVTEQLEWYSDEDVPITIIAIDDKTVEQLGAFENWSREVSAEFVNKLNAKKEKPVIIGIDLSYEMEKDAEGDKAFAKACRRGGMYALQYKRQVRG